MRIKYYFSWSHENTKHPMAQPPQKRQYTQVQELLVILDILPQPQRRRPFQQPSYPHTVVLLTKIRLL